MESAIITLDIETFFVVAFAIVNLIVLGPIAWLLRGSLQDLRDLERNHYKLKEELPEKYVRQDIYARDIDEIKQMLQKIFGELKEKVDK